MRNSAQEEGKRWLLQAIENLRWAKQLAKEDGWHIACFLSQLVCLCYVHYRHPHRYFVHYLSGL